MDDRRAALLLALLALAGAGVRLALAPAKAAAPGDVRLVSVDTPPPGGLSATARNVDRPRQVALRVRRRGQRLDQNRLRVGPHQLVVRDVRNLRTEQPPENAKGHLP